MTKLKDLKVGMQIAYIPDHANGDINHSDVELGFVSAVGGYTVSCRYFYKGSDELRTKQNGETTYLRNLVIYKHRRQTIINRLMREIDAKYLQPELPYPEDILISAKSTIPMECMDADPADQEEDELRGLGSDYESNKEFLSGW